jgi:8-oxo-dGTP pyrophosphatase MutT (NUDIX family)
MKLKFFAESMFNVCPILKNYISDVSKATSHFQNYKSVIPVRGAIILNKKMTKALMVKGWKANSTWGFPRGKINKNEPDDLCAIREVYEEIGFDISPYLNPDDFIDVTIRQKNFKLYIVTGVPGNSKFCPQTRKEISKIEWHEVTSLPAFSSDSTVQDSTRYFMVAPFMEGLSKFIAKKRGLPSKFSSSETAALKNLLGVGSSSPSQLNNKEDPAAELFKLLKNSSNSPSASNTGSTETDKNILLDLLHGTANSSKDSKDSNAPEILSLLKTNVDRSQENESLNNFQSSSNGFPPPMGQIGMPPPWQYPVPQMGFLPPVPPGVNVQYGVPQFPGAPVPFGVPGYPVPPPFLPQGFPMPPPPPQMVPPPSEPSTPLQQHANLSGSIQQSVFDVPRSPTQTPLPNSTLLALLNSRSKGKRVVEHKKRPTHSHTSSNSSSMALLSLLKQPEDGSSKKYTDAATESSKLQSNRYSDSQSRNTITDVGNHSGQIPSSTSLLNQLRGVPPQPTASPGVLNSADSTSSSANNILLGLIKGDHSRKPRNINSDTSAGPGNASFNLLNQLKNPSTVGQRNRSPNSYASPGNERSLPLSNESESPYDPSADLLNQIKGVSASQSNTHKQPASNNSSSEVQLLNLLHGKPNTLQPTQNNAVLAPETVGSQASISELSKDATSASLLSQLKGSQSVAPDSGTFAGENLLNDIKNPNIKTNPPISDTDKKSELLGLLKSTTQPSQSELSSSLLMGMLKGNNAVSNPETVPTFEDPAILNATTSFPDTGIPSSALSADNDSAILLGMLKSQPSNTIEPSGSASGKRYKGGLTLHDLENSHARKGSQSPGKDLLQQLELEESQANPTPESSSLLSFLNNPSTSATPSASYHSSRANSQTHLQFSPVPQENSPLSWGVSASPQNIQSGVASSKSPAEPLKNSQSTGNNLLSFLKGTPSPKIDSTNAFESFQGHDSSSLGSARSSSPNLGNNLTGQRTTPVNSVGSSLLKGEPISASSIGESAQPLSQTPVSEQDHFSSLLAKLQLPAMQKPIEQTAPAPVHPQPMMTPAQISQTGPAGYADGKELRNDLLAFLHNFSNGTLPANK